MCMGGFMVGLECSCPRFGHYDTAYMVCMYQVIPIFSLLWHSFDHSIQTRIERNFGFSSTEITSKMPI